MVKKSVKNGAKKIKKEVVDKEISIKKVDDNEPSWYHYVIVLLFFGSVFWVVWFAFSFYDEQPIDIHNSSNVVLHKYPYVVGNVTYNIYFQNSVDEIESMDFVVEPNKLDVLNTRRFVMSFMDYNGADNGEVTKSSTKVISFLKNVYRFKFDKDSFKMINESNCSTSSINYKVVLFNPYSNVTGVFYNNSNGCIEFLADSPDKIVSLSDKFIYDVINAK